MVERPVSGFSFDLNSRISVSGRKWKFDTMEAVFRNGQVMRKVPDLPQSNTCIDCGKMAGTMREDALDADDTVIEFELTFDSFPFDSRYRHRKCMAEKGEK